MILTTKERKSRVIWIDNLKLIAAILVIISHYAQLIAKDSIVAPSYIVFLNRYPFALFTNGEFWVCAFCVLSGLLADKKIIRSFDELLLSYVTRYFRFLIPVGIANLYALINYKIASAGEYHTGGFLDFARCTFALDNSINPTLWVMRHILIGTLLIYTVNYLISKVGGVNNCICVIIKCVITTILLLFNYTFFIGVCFIGATIAELMRFPERSTNSRIIAYILFTVGILLSGVQNLLSESLDLRFISINQYWEAFYAFVCVYCISIMGKKIGILTSRKLHKYSSLSLAVYIFHFPIVCTLSYSLLEYGVQRCSSFEAPYILVLLITLIVAVAIAGLLSKPVDMITSKAISLINVSVNRFKQ